MITKLTQTESFPRGDCVRTVFSCLLGHEDNTDVPNFMKDGESNYYKNLKTWLNDSDLSYMEVSMEEFYKASMMPLGYCTIVGKSNINNCFHMIIGESNVIKNEGTSVYRQLKFIYDVSPIKMKDFSNFTPEYVGFLTRNLKALEDK